MTTQGAHAPLALWLCACTASIGGELGPVTEAGSNTDGTSSNTGAVASEAAAGSTGGTSGAQPGTTGAPIDTSAAPTPDVPVTIDDISQVTDPSSLPDLVKATSQLPRLPHTQYQNALRELLGLPIDVVADFASEQPTLDGYYAPAALRVNERLYLDYQRVAEQLAQELVDTPAAYAQLVGCVVTAAGCRDEFVQRFLLRAYRRPPTTTELDRYRALFELGQSLVQSGDAFADGVSMVVQAALQSPNFLYRIERGVGDASSPVELTAFEKAARLAFMLTDAPPDAVLLEEAGAGRLASPAELASQASRLLALPAFVARVRDFHYRWLQLEGLLSASKDSSAFPEFSPELGAMMQAETLRFVEEATLNHAGAIVSLLSAPYSFVNQSLAAVYGLQGNYTTELVRVDFAPTDRRLGLFTQPAFLTGHSSSSTHTSPILRAVYLLRRILCQEIPDPPPGAQATEPPTPQVAPVTTRDLFTWKTSLASCSTCHSFINPVGFAFEEFDAIGRRRASENGAPIDSTGSVKLGDQEIQFRGGSELLSALAQSSEARACYAKHWLEFGYGRSDGSEDLRTLATLHQALADPGYGVRDLVLQLTQSAAFSSLLRLAE